MKRVAIIADGRIALTTVDEAGQKMKKHAISKPQG